MPPPTSRGLVFCHRQQFIFVSSPCPCCRPVVPTGKWQDGWYHLQRAHATTLCDEFSLLQQCMPSPLKDANGSISIGHIVTREICMQQGKLRAMDNRGARKRIGPRTLRGTTGADNNPTLQYRGAINGVILIDRDECIKLRRRKKKSGCKLPPSQNRLFSKFLSRHQMSVTMSLASITVTRFSFLEGAMEPFCLQKIQCSRLRLLLFLLGAKER
jgi:hypothetical protein